jgi:hypothetical protein
MNVLFLSLHACKPAASSTVPFIVFFTFQLNFFLNFAYTTLFLVKSVCLPLLCKKRYVEAEKIIWNPVLSITNYRF